MDKSSGSTLGVISLIVATVTSGLLAGLYYAYACSIMPAFNKLDDKTYVIAFNKINDVIVNPVFMLSFLGSVVFSIAAALFSLRTELRPMLIWIVVAVALNIVSLIVTSVFNIPLNNDLATANDAVGKIDYAALRENFETPWVTWNIIRGIANTGALGALTWALVQYGRLTH